MNALDEMIARHIQIAISRYLYEIVARIGTCVNGQF